jgi:hypothetical protein
VARLFAIISICFAFAAIACPARAAVMQASPVAPIDSDRDGMSDDLEQALLQRFLPSFWVDRNDCAGVPAQFLPALRDPVVASEDATIYGQATPHKSGNIAGSQVELRYYHLWGQDCGSLGHPLDAEHVAVLIEPGPGAFGADGWKALYWYAAAHQDTICDASQITRASGLEADTAGARVWISRGKHASFLRPELCHHGCGGDVCREMSLLAVKRVVNLGEVANPMNGALWAESSQWSLAAKMSRSDFDPQVIARLERLPGSDIAWVNPSLSPAKATIAAGGSTADSIALANRKTDTAISTAGGATGSSLGTTYDKISQSLKKSASGVGRFLRGELRDPKAPRLPQTEPEDALPKTGAPGASNH